ncbi:hypothetical protein J6W34_04630 [bacterium]|nr:hypothetical protein [bacterium]
MNFKRMFFVMFLIIVSAIICNAETLTGIGTPYGITPTGTDTVYINQSVCGVYVANSENAGDFSKVVLQNVESTVSFVASSTTSEIPSEIGTVLLTASSASDIATLNKGGVEGQKLTIVMVECGSGAKCELTGLLLTGSKITFDAVGESAVLLFTKGKWIMIMGTATLS